jgi:hypothetical protein
MTPVDVPLQLRLPVTAGSVPEMASYDLYAIVVHVGTFAEFGHYYAYTRDSSTCGTASSSQSMWRRCDDSSVSDAGLDDYIRDVVKSVAATPYMAFYKKVGGGGGAGGVDTSAVAASAVIDVDDALAADGMATVCDGAGMTSDGGVVGAGDVGSDIVTGDAAAGAGAAGAGECDVHDRGPPGKVPRVDTDSQATLPFRVDSRLLDAVKRDNAAYLLSLKHHTASEASEKVSKRSRAVASRRTVRTGSTPVVSWFDRALGRCFPPAAAVVVVEVEEEEEEDPSVALVVQLASEADLEAAAAYPLCFDEIYIGGGTAALSPRTRRECRACGRRCCPR